MLETLVLVIGGLWLLGRISRGFDSHAANQSSRIFSPYSHPVSSELLDNSAVSDDTAYEHGAFTVGEPDDFAPPMITGLEQTPAGINESVKPSGSKCCGGLPSSAPAPPLEDLPAPGQPTAPIIPTRVTKSQLSSPIARPVFASSSSGGTKIVGAQAPPARRITKSQG